MAPIAFLAKSQPYLRGRNLKFISTFVHLQAEPQLVDLPASHAPALPPNPASGSPRYSENWRNPSAAFAGDGALVPIGLGFLQQTQGSRMLMLAQSLDAESLINQFADWMTTQRWEDMKNLFEFWVRSLNKNGKPNTPDVNLYNHYLRANVMIGASVAELLDIVAQMDDYSVVPNAASFNLVLKAMQKTGETLAAEKLIESMLQTGKIHKESLPDNESFDLVIEMLLSRNNIDSALKYVDLTLKSGYMLSMKAFVDCVQRCVNNGRLDTLVSIIERCKKMDQNKSLCPPWRICNYLADITMQSDKFMAKWIARGKVARPPIFLSVEEGLFVTALGTAGRTYNSRLLDGAWAVLKRSLRENTLPNPESYLEKIFRPTKLTTPSLALLRLHFHSLTTAAAPPNPINEAHLLRVCTILYQQQNSPDAKLHTNLTKTQFHLTHEFFLQVCNKFPYSWRPVYKFHQFSTSHPHFSHTTITFNKILDVVGKSRNLDLFWALCRESGERRLVNVKTYIIALRTLAAARELKKCVEFFHLMKGFGYEYKVEIFNIVIEVLCRNKLANEARHVVVKLRDWIRPDLDTYRWLIHGFCDVGDLIEASKLWNLMEEVEGLEPSVEVVELMLEGLFKKNKFGEGLNLFQSMRVRRAEGLGLSTYRLVIEWLCKKGKMGESYVIFEEMKMNGIEPDNKIVGWIIYGLMSKGRVREAYGVYQSVESGDLSVYHGMMKGLLRLKRAGEATEVFREMVRRGCEPTMHTYVMLLQGHLGRRGRRGEDPLVNFDTIFVGGLIKSGKSLEATKYVERAINRGVEVPRFDYNKFLHYFSNEEGTAMFEAMALKLREVGLFDLADILARYGEKMATRDRRRDRPNPSVQEDLSCTSPSQC